MGRWLLAYCATRLSRLLLLVGKEVEQSATIPRRPWSGHLPPAHDRQTRTTASPLLPASISHSGTCATANSPQPHACADACAEPLRPAGPAPGHLLPLPEVSIKLGPPLPLLLVLLFPSSPGLPAPCCRPHLLYEPPRLPLDGSGLPLPLPAPPLHFAAPCCWPHLLYERDVPALLRLVHLALAWQENGWGPGRGHAAAYKLGFIQPVTVMGMLHPSVVESLVAPYRSQGRVTHKRRARGSPTHSREVPASLRRSACHPAHFPAHVPMWPCCAHATQLAPSLTTPLSPRNPGPHLISPGT